MKTLSPAPAFAVQDLQVQLGGRSVLSGVQLQFPQGRWTSVIGPNGAGKSTLLRALAGLQAAQGRIQFLGREAAQWSPRDKARHLAWLGQHESVGEDMRVGDVVMLGRLPHQPWWGSPSEQDHAVVAQVLAQTQCQAWIDRPIGALSGGERQRVLLARALAVQAPVMLMDEPLANLDFPHQADWWAVVRQQVAAGHTVVSVLHELGMALQADEVLVLAQGRVRFQGPTASQAARDAIEAVLDHRVRLVEVEGQWVPLQKGPPPEGLP